MGMAGMGPQIPAEPALPPEQSGQMGFADAGAGVQGYGVPAAEPEPQQANPYAELFAQGEAINTVLEQMAAAEPGFSAFARQAIEVITDGLASIASQPQGQGSLPPEMASSLSQGGAPAGPPMA